MATSQPPTDTATGNHGQAVGLRPHQAQAGSRHPCCKSSETGRADGIAPRGSTPISCPQLLYAVSPEGLYESLQKCVRGTNWKRSVAAFELHGLERCQRLSEELRTGTYRPRPPRRFFITRPKKRECCSIHIRDRVFQRSINDNVIYPAMVKSLIKENCACQKGKGTSYARDLFERQLKNLWHECGTDGYALQLDIKGYYPNMRHEVALKPFERYLTPDAYAMVEAILTSQYAGEVGFQAGSQLVQIAGISALSSLDHYIKERLRAKRYIRYMDDMIILAADRSYLEECRQQIASELAKLGYELNTSKTRIIRASERIGFLGFTFQLRESGKVIRRMKQAKKRDILRRLNRIYRATLRGNLTPSVACEIAQTHIRYAQHECTDRATPLLIKRRWKELEMQINQIKDPAALREIERLNAETAKNQALIDYLSMESGVELPVEEADDGEE